MDDLLILSMNPFATKDPYEVGQRARQTRFLWTRRYVPQTDFGYKFHYTVSCRVNKIARAEFKAARMLEESSQAQLLDLWHNQVFHPTLLRMGFSFRFHVDRFENLPLDNPAACYVVPDQDGNTVYWDPNCTELRKCVTQVPFEANGCAVKLSRVQLDLDEALVKENYNMVKLRAGNAFENTVQYREFEEATAVTFLNRYFELQRTLQQAQTAQEHHSNHIVIKTKLVGQAVEISWILNSPTGDSDCVLRGYRSESGFTNETHLGAQGLYVVEARRPGNTVQQHEPGKTYFYTFLLTRDEPVHRNAGLGDTISSVLGSPVVQGFQTKILDTVRFSLRVPTREEMKQVETMLERIRTNRDPAWERNEKDFGRVTSFLEFDERLSELKKESITRIRAKKYAQSEEKDKLEKLDALIDQLRMARI